MDSRKKSRTSWKQACRRMSKDVFAVLREDDVTHRQIEAMWNQYRFELSYEPPWEAPHDEDSEEVTSCIADDTSGDNDVSSDIDSVEFLFSRFMLVPRNLHLYPTKKSGHTSKSRRYIPCEKFSDRKKVHGKPKGRSFRKLKSDKPCFYE